jgi:hypothetical protein
MMSSIEINYFDTSISDILRVSKVEEFRGLNRLEKGFAYEMIIQRLLKANNVDFSANSNSFNEWLNYQIEGYDFKIWLPNGKTIRVECKLLLKPIFHSWFKRDWLTRNADVFVTNDVYSIPYEDRRILERQGKKLLSTTEFIVFIQKLIRGNKYAYLNNSDKHVSSLDNKEIILQESENRQIQKQKKENLLDLIDKKEKLHRSLNTEAIKTETSCNNCIKRYECEILRNSDTRKYEAKEKTCSIQN